MTLLTLAEAAQFLRKSKSWLYQNSHVPRHRPPGSRCYLFDRDELVAWIKSGENRTPLIEASSVEEAPTLNKPDAGVYHRNPRYR
ncbi:MAG: DNA-binding protein [Nitrospirae bacterium]|nr:MAG: DNA-binding protein [Nitrospirota bacterium]